MKPLKQLSLTTQFLLKSLFFLQYIPLSLIYSLTRDRLERQYRPPLDPAPFQPPGKLLQVSSTDRGATFEFEQAELAIDFLTSDLVRVHWSPGLPPIPYAIACQDWEPVTTTLTETGDNWTIASSSLSVTVGAEGNLTWKNAAGEILRQENPPQRQEQRWIHQACLHLEEQIYGLGERATTFNLRAPQPGQSARTYQMWNYDPAGRYQPGTDPMYICIPVYWGLHQTGSYLIFYENSFRAQFTFSDTATADFEGGSLRYYFTCGDPPRLLERYSQLTGRPPLPARWALGYHQSRWGYRTEDNIRREIQAFRDHDLPISAIHLDIDCQAGHRPFTLDPDRFPQLASFIQELSEVGVRFITINNPGVKYSHNSNLCLEGQILGGFCTYPNGELVIAPVWAGKMVFPDFTNPQVRAWWSRQYAYLLDVGVAGFWHDMNEPAAFVLWGDHTLPTVAQHSLEGRGGNHLEAHNVYGLLEAEAAYESIREYRPHQRPFIVSRSGWAGLQRYAWTWTGDTICTWAALHQTVSTVVGLGLSGIPYSGPDIGGFQGNPTAELYLRWFQMATFLTFYRTHSSTSVMPRSPWAFGEPYLSIIRRFMQLRYRLIPYLYTLTWQAHQWGYPPVRPLFWYDWQDSRLWNVDDAFYLGDALLICPIVQPGATDASTQPHSSRTIPLPQGKWYDFWTDAPLEGDKTVTLSASLEQIPILVKAGSILPLSEDQQMTLHLYPPEQGKSEYQLYSDAGEGYGESRVDRFSLTRHEQGLELTWEQQGEYPFPYETICLKVHGLPIQQAWVDDQQAEVQDQMIQCDRFQRIWFSSV